MASIYQHGTELRSRSPWGIMVGGRAVCPDGVVRALSRIATTADTFFSIPASVKVRGKTVAGYVTCNENEAGRWVEFRPYDYRKNADVVFPRKPFVALGDLEFAARYGFDAASKDVRF